MSTINIQSSERAVLIMETTIKNSWSFLAFCSAFGQPKLAHFTNGETGEQFSSVMFIKNEGQANEQKTLCNFSEKLGQLTAKEVSARKHDLQVIQNSDDKFYICNKGAQAWEDIEI